MNGWEGNRARDSAGGEEDWIFDLLDQFFQRCYSELVSRGLDEESEVRRARLIFRSAISLSRQLFGAKDECRGKIDGSQASAPRELPLS